MTSSLSPLGKEKFFFTSESVTEGHPDKVADFVSDSILDACLEQDPLSRVACETLLTCNWVVVAGEITTKANVNWPEVIRKAIRTIGYVDAKAGLDADTAGVTVAINRQSPDIAMGVDTGGAGDQGMMFGFANRETPELMPLPIMLAHRLAEKLTQVRKSKKLNYLRPDGKTQVSVEYIGGKPVRIDAVVVSTQHAPINQAKLKKDIIRHVIRTVVPANMIDSKTKIFVNPTGNFEIGGPLGDTGLTGRKIIVDTYGGYGRHGGGAFSGKDPSKVDRSAAYAARWVAKNIVAAGLADQCEVQISYAIGVAQPTSVLVNTFGTGRLPEEQITQLVRKFFDLTPKGIITSLKLRRPIYKKTAAYGHFGRHDKNFTWENTDKAALLRKAAKLR
ncbi:MAG TPA: methionine adenosyltransferase [bacterium]|jgi:S-adenosylmethionine synthetase|nr:methionine adenosyltransferase [bacterium]